MIEVIFLYFSKGVGKVSTRDKYTIAQRIAYQYEQEQLLRLYDELTEAEKYSLLDQIISTKLDLVESLFDKLVRSKEEQVSLSEFEPLIPEDLSEASEEARARYYEKGIELIRNGKVAVVLLAGGQGTRLGHEGPKGTYSIGLPSGKSLFQLQCERLINLAKKAGRYIPWYIMTSPENHKETISFFETFGYFGYPKEDIYFFEQGVLPLLGEDGKIIMSSKSGISTGPDGNGGCLLALEDKGYLTKMKEKGIEWLYINGVDNALVRVADPYFLGYTALSGFKASNKVVSKKHAEEKAGVLCSKNGRPTMVEYSEMTAEMAHAKDCKGKLLYDNANIITHMFRMDFVEECLAHNIPFHAAHKKVQYIDNEGKLCNPDKPNCYKFESFIFDLFPLLERIGVLRVNREDEFAPVKNKEGEDSPETARQLMFGMYKRWLSTYGLEEAELDDKLIEISPLTSYYGEGIDAGFVKAKLQREKIVSI